MDKPRTALVPAAGANYGERGGTPIDCIIIHVMEGSLPGTAAHFQDPDAQVSAHYGIGSDGAILQFVGEERAAWHAGNRSYNRRSLGVEIEGYSDRPETFTEPMYRSLLALCKYLCAKYDIARNRVGVIGHYSVPDPNNRGQYGGSGHHTDPGPYFPWDRFLDDLNQGSLPC